MWTERKEGHEGVGEQERTWGGRSFFVVSIAYPGDEVVPGWGLLLFLWVETSVDRTISVVVTHAVTEGMSNNFFQFRRGDTELLLCMENRYARSTSRSAPSEQPLSLRFVSASHKCQKHC